MSFFQYNDAILQKQFLITLLLPVPLVSTFASHYVLMSSLIRLAVRCSAVVPYTGDPLIFFPFATPHKRALHPRARARELHPTRPYKLQTARAIRYHCGGDLIYWPALLSEFHTLFPLAINQ